MGTLHGVVVKVSREVILVDRVPLFIEIINNYNK